MAIKAITFDAYGTLIRNEDLRLVPQRIVVEHGLSVSVDAVLQTWIDLYHEATRRTPFSTLREIQRTILTQVLHGLEVDADAGPFVDQFFELTTKVELYPEVVTVLNGLGGRRSAIVSNADREHIAAWTFALPVEFVLGSEDIGVYKPDPRVFQMAVERFGLQPGEVLHVGDSEIDDVVGAKAAGLRAAWLNRAGRQPRPEGPAADFEISDLTQLALLL
jgi:2-haloalkanoic acid dehalogenase type II